MIECFQRTLTCQKILLLQCTAAAAMLGGALIAQYAFRLHPCELCIMQRYPYAAVMATAIFAAWLAKLPKLQRAAIFFCAILFALDAGIALYHAGVELDIFTGPDACSAGARAGQTIEELRAEIMAAPLVSCKQAMAYFLGLSMAAWNGLVASVYTLLSVFGALHVRRI